MSYSTQPRSWYWIAAIVFLLWNIMGVAAWTTEVSAPEFMLEKMNANQQELYNARPAWYIYVYAGAVFMGITSCLSLFFKKRTAVITALISLLCVIITTGFNTYNGVWDKIGNGDRFFYIAVPLLSMLLWIIARAARRRNWLR